MDLCAGSNGDADTQNRRVDTVGGIGRGGWGEGGADGERAGRTGRGARKHTPSPYVKQTVSGNLLCDSGSSDWGSVTT